MESIQIWHGTLIQNIKKFRFLSHFGTETQALRIIAASAALDGKCGQPLIYECKLSYEENERKHVDDIGSPNAQAIFKSYCDALGQRDTFKERLRYAIENELSPNDPRWHRSIIDLAKKNGHKLLSYNNKFEGEGLSYCVIDEDIVSIVSCVSLTWGEFVELYEEKSNCSHGFTEQQLRLIQNFLAKVSSELN